MRSNDSDFAGNILCVLNFFVQKYRNYRTQTNQQKNKVMNRTEQNKQMKINSITYFCVHVIRCLHSIFRTHIDIIPFGFALKFMKTNDELMMQNVREKLAMTPFTDSIPNLLI